MWSLLCRRFVDDFCFINKHRFFFIYFFLWEVSMNEHLNERKKNAWWLVFSGFLRMTNPSFNFFYISFYSKYFEIIDNPINYFDVVKLFLFKRKIKCQIYLTEAGNVFDRIGCLSSHSTRFEFYNFGHQLKLIYSFFIFCFLYFINLFLHFYVVCDCEVEVTSRCKKKNYMTEMLFLLHFDSIHF